MAKKKSPVPINTPFLVGDRVHPIWIRFFEQFLSVTETQTDATATTSDVVTKFNQLIDKLQASGQME